MIEYKIALEYTFSDTRSIFRAYNNGWRDNMWGLLKLNRNEFTYFAMFNPLKNLKTSRSDACHGNPRAFTTVSSGTRSVFSLFEENEERK